MQTGDGGKCAVPFRYEQVCMGKYAVAVTCGLHGRQGENIPLSDSGKVKQVMERI